MARKKNGKFGILFYLILIPCIIGIWAFIIEPNLVMIDRYKIKNTDFAGMKIVMAGDFHFRFYDKYRLHYIIQKINAENPDMVLFVGDYINTFDASLNYPIEQTAEEFKNIKSKYGIYAVLGNHDYFAEGDRIKKALKDNGIKVLENSSAKIDVNGKNLYIAGITDLTTTKPDLKKALRNVKNSSTILLSHQPWIYNEVPNDIMFVLSGHTHGGQVHIPFYKPKIYEKMYINGYIENEYGKKMIITKGLGTSIVPARFFCPPDIVVVEFVKNVVE